MAVFTRKGSPWYYMLLEGTGRKRENTFIRCDATSAKLRKANADAAEAIYHARMTQLAKTRVGLPSGSKETFKTFSTWYEEHHTAKHKSPDRERVILAHLRAHFGSLRLAGITPPRWTEYETKRVKAGVSINTIGRELQVMKSILVAAVGEHLDVSPLAHVKRKSTRVPPKRTITAAEEKRLLEELTSGETRGGTYGDDEMRDLYLLGVGTLLRQLNLILLQREQVQGTRVVAQTKTGPHAVSLGGPTILQRRCLAIVTRRLPRTAKGDLFPRWAARFRKDRNAANAKFLQGFRRACRRAGIPWGLQQHGVVWHTATRASGATRLIRDYRIDVRTVQLLGNWRSLDQMAEYLGVDTLTPKQVKRRSA